MSIIQDIKSQIKEAMIAKDAVRRDILRLVIGQVQQSGDESDEAVIKIIKKIIKSNTETVEALESRDHVDVPEVLKLEDEIDFLEPYVPKAMSAEEIKAFISDNSIDLSSAKNDGQAMGMLMKPLKGTGREIDSVVVKSVIAELK